jgi:threonine dehydratase
MSRPLPTYADVVDAARRIEGYIHHTPVLRSASIDDRVGAEVYAKAENLQRVGAFKARGALNTILSLDDAHRRRGIATHSSGNHGQAVAYAARTVGATAVVVVPDHAPEVKVAAIEGYGATIVRCPQADRERVLAALVDEHGYTVVHPFDDARVIAGQGTAALELVAAIPDLDIIITPIGGGGLLSGTTIVGVEHGIATLGAEPAVVDDAARSLADGIRHGPTGAVSVGDGLLTGIGELAFTILSGADVEVVTVSEDEIMEATRFVVTRTKSLIEPSAGTAFAALFSHASAFRGARVGVIVSGGNADLAMLGAWPVRVEERGSGS